jgi:hypothetical protein
VVLVIATHPIVQGSRPISTSGPRVQSLDSTAALLVVAHKKDTARPRWFATQDYDSLIERLASLQQAYDDQVAYLLAAIDAAAQGFVPSALIPVNTDLWERLHNCEQPDTWYASGTNPDSESGTVFQGGLGMSVGAWQMAARAAAARGVSLPRSAMDASVYQQMVGAQAFHDAYGWAWGCRV